MVGGERSRRWLFRGWGGRGLLVARGRGGWGRQGGGFGGWVVFVKMKKKVIRSYKKY